MADCTGLRLNTMTMLCSLWQAECQQCNSNLSDNNEGVSRTLPEGGRGGCSLCIVNTPAHVVECLEDCQAIPFIHPKEGIMQHQQLPTVHELACHRHPSLSPHRKVICNTAPEDTHSDTWLDDTHSTAWLDDTQDYAQKSF